MFIYRVTNSYTGEVYETRCEDQTTACRYAYEWAMRNLRELAQSRDLVPEGCVLHDLPQRKRQYLARKYMRFGRVDVESNMMLYALPLV